MVYLSKILTWLPNHLILRELWHFLHDHKELIYCKPNCFWRFCNICTIKRNLLYCATVYNLLGLKYTEIERNNS